MAAEDNLAAAGIPYPLAAEIQTALKSGGSTTPDKLTAVGVAPPLATELARQLNARQITVHLLTGSGFPPASGNAVRAFVLGLSMALVTTVAGTQIVFTNNEPVYAKVL